MTSAQRNKLTRWTLLLLPAPLVAGLIMFQLMAKGILDTKEGLPIYLYLPIALAFLAFWAWVGNRFAALNIGKVYSFLLGNSTTFISSLVLLVFGEPAWAIAISKWPSLLSGLFILPVANLSSGIVGLFVNL